MENDLKYYVIDACALIAYFRGEEGGEKLRKLFKESQIKCYMHAANLGEVYYDSIRYSDKKYAKQLLEDVKKLPIHFIWNLDEDFIELLGEYKTTYSISYADAFVLALAKRENATIVTTDYHEFLPVEESGSLSFFWLRKKDEKEIQHIL
ncbi:MAG: type II toxin-antitoxin system VapC family toxin [Candidatus Aminicenantes bacterium]|nr:MAG: type II toxin-antitoxin system VapC family toxin [Candidatus Aminicenantes bacterium]